jgi:hypothetical protein
MLERWGVLTSCQDGGSKRISIAPTFFAKYQQRLRNLKIYNIDKNVQTNAEDKLEEAEDVLGRPYYKKDFLDDVFLTEEEYDEHFEEMLNFREQTNGEETFNYYIEKVCGWKIEPLEFDFTYEW